MRKKLLALLMCATMVLGSSAVASAATITNDNISDAIKIVNQFDDGAVEKEFDAKKTSVTFATTFTNATKSNAGVYTYAFYKDGSDYKYVKTSSNGNTPYTLTNGKELTMAELDLDTQLVSFESTYTTYADTTEKNFTTNPSAGADEVLNAVVKGIDRAYYFVADAVTVSDGEAVPSGYLLVQKKGDVTNLNDAVGEDSLVHTDGTTTMVAVQLKSYDNTIDTATSAVSKTIDSFGVDPDNYIALKDSSIDLLKLSSSVASGYWVGISSAAGSEYKIAQALANGDITANAVAVKLDFYTVSDADDKTATVNGYTQSTFKKFEIAKKDKTDVDVTFKSDWLSRSNAKNANVVYVLNDNYSVDSVSEYLYKTGSVFMSSDLSDGTFTTNYIKSGVYLFDTVDDASQNDGVSDTDTTATTTAASTTAATSPKTGDVAPIAALAVVMMGACGAMVVASKKRA
jgi:hypothetical protein